MKVWTSIAVWLSVLVALQLLATRGRLVALVAAGVTSLYVADLILKSYDVFWRQRRKMKDVAGKAVFITGCDTGFGYQLAQRLARMGFQVYAGCLDPHSKGGKSLSAGGNTSVLALDVTRPQDIAEAHRTVARDMEDKGLTLWSVVNNAGVAVMAEVEFQSLEGLARVFDVNTLGPLRVAQTFLPLLRAAGRGRIVNVASQAGRLTAYGYTPYSMSKHALVALTEGLRREVVKWGISVHSIEPTLYSTAIVNKERNRSNMLRAWDDASDEVRHAYGRPYFEAFVEKMLESLHSAKPCELVYEVIDDMEDAVAGLHPQAVYLPNTASKALVRLLRALPTSVLDTFFMKGAPSVGPHQASLP